jgi:hypothetical protein
VRARRVVRWLAGIAALVVVSTLVGLTLVEVAVRSGRCVNRLGGGLNVRDRFYGWGNRANVDATLRRCINDTVEFESHLRTNRWGMRGGDVDHARRPGVTRILALGDSFTLGVQVNDDRLFSTLLAERLSERRPTEVLNAGVNGWGTDNAVLYYEQEGWRFEPDVVLLLFDTTNDVYENSRRMLAMRPFYADKPYFDLEQGRLELRHHPLATESPVRTFVRAVVGRLALSSAAFAQLAARPDVLELLTLPPPRPPADGVLADPPQVMLRDYPAHWTDAWRVTRGLLLRLQRAAASHGAVLVVAVVTSKEEVSPDRLKLARIIYRSIATADLDPDKPNRLVTSFLTRRRIPYVSLLAPFRERFAESGMPGFFDVDIHWAPAGHALAAETIARRIAELETLRDGSGS